MEEFNKEQLETNKLPKQEYSDVGSTEPIKEYGSYKKAKTTAKVTSLAITIIGAGLVLGSFLAFALTTNKVTTVVEQFNITSEINQVNYDIIISETKSDNLKLKLYNNYITETKSISSGETIGSFTQLVANTEYTISLLENNVIVKTEKIWTLKEGL